MDADCFDRLTRFVAILRSRRGLFSLFAGAPLAGALTTLLPDAAEARRGHRRKAHRADRDRVGPEKKKKGKKKKCKPKPLATICGDRCGPVKNNCKKTVNCGSCACSPTCTTCQRCN